MTEAEWLGATDPVRMLEFLRGKASDRKLRLFACGWARKAGLHLPGESSRRALEVSEGFADGRVSDGERASAFATAAEEVSRGWSPSSELSLKFCSAFHAAYAVGMGLGEIETHLQPDPLSWLPRPDKAVLLRDIFGNPFRPVTADPKWLTSTVISLAGGIYDDRAFDRLPILADALQDAGCEDAEILCHCRSEGVHVRGCWVVDLVLGKG
jgi:hypothetical protein